MGGRNSELASGLPTHGITRRGHLVTVAAGEVDSLTDPRALAGLHGDTATARALLLEELEIEEQLGDKRATGFALNNLQRVAGWEDREDDAMAWNERALRIFQEIEEPLALADAG
jgi:hypothetical protein